MDKYTDNLNHQYQLSRRDILKAGTAVAGLSLSVIPKSAFASGTVSSINYSSSPVFSAPIFYNGYGVHCIQGVYATQYLYSPQGTFKQYTGMLNIYAYYNTTQANFNNLLAYANGSSADSVVDLDGHVLYNLAYNSNTASGASFHEHSGIGAGGQQLGQPFTNFWFDDNWLARYVTVAYGSPQPSGLFNPGNYERWQILALDTTNWKTPTANAPDLYALIGMYYVATGNYSGALTYWNNILNVAGSNYDGNTQRYTYDGLTDTYYLALFKILTENLLDKGLSDNILAQHSAALRATLLIEQQYQNGNPIGWTTSRANTSGSLINTETTSCCILGLGAKARYSYEAGYSPLTTGNGFFLRSYFVLSAVQGQTPAGVMSYGPYTQFGTGNYAVQFYLRSPNPPSGQIAYIDVHDSNSNTILASKSLTGNMFQPSNQWTRFVLTIGVANTSNSLEFRVYYMGGGNLDLATIKIL